GGSMPRLAVDTNVLARGLVDDGSEQAMRSRQCMIENEVFVSDTVLLETEWLLRSRMNLDRQQINSLFSGLLATPNAHFSNRESIVEAIIAHQAGFDFADALHLVGAGGCDAMVTFDRNFIRLARKNESSVQVRTP
ncbi:MAG: type II toxin-antitoxin system VapC family toxin, partial [Rhizobiales bacterium]|nr:type II toxin-antitoxin system VapC family toxin [Hyphomicrobiales bacterium]